MGKRGKKSLSAASGPPQSPFAKTKLARLLILNGLTIDLCEEDKKESATESRPRTPSKVLHLKGTNTQKKGDQKKVNSLANLSKINRPAAHGKRCRRSDSEPSESEDECGTVITSQAVAQRWTRQSQISRPASPSKTKNLLGSSSNLFGASSDSLAMENFLYGVSESKNEFKEQSRGDSKITEVISEATAEAENETCCGDSVLTGPYEEDVEAAAPPNLFETSMESLAVEMFLSSVTDQVKDSIQPIIKTRGVARADTETTADTVATDEESKSHEIADTSPSCTESKDNNLKQEDIDSVQSVPSCVVRELPQRSMLSDFSSQQRSKRSLLIEHMKTLDQRLDNVLGKLNGVALRLKETQAGPDVVDSSDDGFDSDDTEYLLRRLRRTSPRKGRRKKVTAKIPQETSEHSKSSRLSSV
jgi:hypothetical protein